MFTAEKIHSHIIIPSPPSPVKIAAILVILVTAAQFVPAAADFSHTLAIATLAPATALLVMLFTGKNSPEVPKPAVAEAVKPVAAAIPQNQAQAEVVTLLGIFQEKGRFVDFLMEDIAPYSDADVGGWHAPCIRVAKPP